MLQTVVDVLFGCSHRRTTFPLTPGRKHSASPGATRHGTYVACLDCGKEFGYDWNEMRVGKPVAARLAAAARESYSTINR
jgi:hypothetical protein